MAAATSGQVSVKRGEAHRNLTDQITSYQHVLDRMRTRLAAFSADEVEQAAAVLRKVRAGTGRGQLPITAIAARPTA